MAYEKAFSRVSWENEPSVATPLNQTNLNKGDSALDIIDDRVVAMDSRLTQLEGYEPTVIAYAQRAETGAETSESYAIGKKSGVDVPSSDPAYHNNSLWYSQLADTSATAAATSESNAESSATAASASATAASASKTAAQGYANDALGYKNQASTSADNAASSATLSQSWAVGGTNTRQGENTNNSKWYAEQSADSAQSASDSATAASASASNAATSESNANTLAISAATSAQDASASAVNAANSATNAAVSETNAAASATSAANSATNAANSASSASTSATNAATSASNAATSETNAATSEANASTSETNAATSATNASNSALDSEAWAVGKRNGVDVGSTDDTYENNSKYYSVQSGLSATASANSATASASSATSAENSSLDSEAWSVGERNGTPVEYGDETYHNNAKYWAGQAEQAAGGGVISFNGRNGYVEPQAGDYTKAMVGLGNVDNTADLDKPISTATSTALANKMPLVTGQQGQVIGFDSQGNPVAQTVPSSGHVIVDEDGVSYPYRNKLKFENSEVEDDATNDTTIVTPRGGTTIVKKPTVTVGTYTYNGQPQGATITWDTGMSQHCVVTNATQTNAGTYTLTIALKNTATMVWNDLTTANLTYTYTISPKSVTVPTVSGAYTYDTTEKSAVVGSYDTDEIIQGGTDSATVVGTYTITFDLASANYVWSDSTTSQKSATWSISKATLTVPTVTNTSKTYNGSVQSPSITGFDSNTMTKVEDSATNAGSYTLMISIADTNNYVWSDSTNAAKTYSWSIAKNTLSVPTVTDTNKTYNGSSQSPTITGFDSDTMVKSGDDSATNAGSYTVSFSLLDSDNYEWDSVTTSFSWSIAKATSVITVSSASVTLDGDHLTATVTVGNNLDRTLSVSTSDSTVATASISGSTVTISNVNQKSGNATITVSAAESANYNASSVTVSVTASFLQIVTFHDGTDAQIKAMLDAYYADSITWSEMGWAVGDTRTIHLNSRSAPNPNSGTTLGAEDITVVIVGHDHHDLATPINGHTKACISVQFREALGSTSYNGTDGTIYVNGDSSYDMSFTKWSNLYMRTYLNGTLLGAIPTGDFKSAIKQSKHYRHTNYNNANAEQVTDTLFLPSYAEIYGTASWTYYTPTSPTEGTQLPYYETASNRIKYANNNGESSGNAIYWWNGSASSYYSSSHGYYWCTVNTGGSASPNYGRLAYGVAPAFAM